MRRKAKDYPIADILEYLGFENVPRVLHGHRKVRCEFHGESNPSASVGRYSFRCFGCGVTGDAIKLLREQGGEPDYQSAIRRAEALTGGTGDGVSRPDEGQWGGSLLD